MKQPINIILADKSILIREGFKSLLRDEKEIVIVAEVDTKKSLLKSAARSNPDVVVIDYCSGELDVTAILELKKVFPEVAVLAISNTTDRSIVENALRSGVQSHLMKHCSKEEIIEAIIATFKGDRFFCGTLLNAIREDGDKTQSPCLGVNLSARELEIIGEISEGFTNKEIANRLCLSSHTVMTHRKNVMAKLGINNTAGIVIYAVKNNIITPNRFLFSAEQN